MKTGSAGVKMHHGKITVTRKQRKLTNMKAILFLLPTMIMILMFNYYPAIAAFYYSFTNWDGFTTPIFVGMGNFKEIFTTRVFSEASWNLLYLTLFSLFITLTIPLLVAEFIYKVKQKRMQNFYRLLFVFPLVIPNMVILLLWQFFLNPEVGFINAILSALGVSYDHLPLWLGSPNTALVSMMLIGLPWINGVAVLIYLAGFQSIPMSILEAAQMDGAKGFRLFFSIELPLVVSQIKLLMILTIIGSIQAFQTPLVLTNGGPGYSTTVPGLIMYKEAVLNNRLGFGSAVGVVLFAIILVFTIINNKYLKSSTEYNAD
jgi:raffinose/stachyose/melibiose transport system permease protein